MGGGKRSPLRAVLLALARTISKDRNSTFGQGNKPLQRAVIIVSDSGFGSSDRNDRVGANNRSLIGQLRSYRVPDSVLASGCCSSGKYRRVLWEPIPPGVRVPRAGSSGQLALLTHRDSWRYGFKQRHKVGLWAGRPRASACHGG